jgi:sigma-E factor negative regulatory protein RseB
MRLVSVSLACLSLLAAATALAQDKKSLDAANWLTRMATAARELTYTGTFVHQFGPRMETMRIAHLYDDKGEAEKLETLDGPPREIVRENETVHCYYPESRVVKLEQGRARRYFPALIGESAESLSAHYQVRTGAAERVAGYECQVVWLQPKDQLRFGHRFCAEAKSGLLLKAAITNEQGEPVEQVAFTALRIGGPLTRESLRSAYVDEQHDWKTDASNWERTAPEGAWYVKDAPAGFRKIMEMQRRMHGRAEPVRQIVFSDGLAAISVFIEPSSSIPAPLRGPRQRGLVSVLTKQLAQHQITVLGEVPEISLEQVANAVSLRK